MKRNFKRKGRFRGKHKKVDVKIKLPHLFRVGRDVATENLVPGQTVYRELLVEKDGKQLRLWNPKRSKFASAMLKGMVFDFSGDESILYLGVSSGTTASHLSDIFRKGIIYGVDSAPRVLREFALLARTRSNLIPILANAAKPEEYSFLVPKVDILYQDVAQSNQSDILIRNAKAFLKKGGIAVLMLKARSINVAEEPGKIFQQEQEKLMKAGFKILDRRRLEPFQRDHLAFLMKWGE